MLSLCNAREAYCDRTYSTRSTLTNTQRRPMRAPGISPARTDHRAVLILARSGVFTYDQGLHGLRAAKQDQGCGRC